MSAQTDAVASAAAVGPPPGMQVRLSSNESPFGPSPAAVAAAGTAVAEAHLYPDDQSLALRRAIAEHDGLALEQVAVGTGSAALLMDAIAHEARAGGDVVAFARSFVVYRLGARNAGARYVEVGTDGPATGERDGYGRGVERLLAAVGDDTRVVAIDNPGNPTGAHLTGEQVQALVAGIPEHVTILLDEAYHHFARGQQGYATADELGLEHPRLLVLRTFSKAHALAGLRIGQLTGPAELVGAIDAWRPRFNVTAASQAAAISSLGDREHLRRCVEGTLAGRTRMATALRELGVPFTDGLGNFLTIELGTASGPVVAAYAGHGVGVRPLEPYGMTEQIRVSVGTPDEVEAFLAASREVLADVPSRG
ncbi:pyridoxal phosphate-dependent aminotransferase [Egicoccus halophilus]|uniref:Putative phenylalanine aminotransferase n=1 Tax=Egicoccus halophilus TaxID=1670830 RepID=A0A8J3A6X9_9ACTN|nr:histidinol-phosphate transaminase [Egicoccus halophilus]GGI05126.1 putative phenylalanine aminotransferase [Egicoccus halophilus]